MEIIINNFDNLLTNNRKYGGMAGLKLGVVLDNENWILKFPKSTRNFQKIEISYTTMPLSEFLGSHIYNLIGVEAHETKLGIKDGKLVVACKDFLNKNEKLYEFREIKNEYVNGLEEELDSITSSSGNGTDLNEIITIMNKNKTFIDNPLLRDRFWDMFVIDAFIGNNDRNNGNWGIILDELSNEIKIAPVYDNGSSFSNTMNEERMEELLNNKERFVESVYISRISAYYENDKHINPLKYIEEMKNLELNKAIIRIVSNIDLKKIKEFIYSIPNMYDGIKVTSEIQKEFYFETLKYRFEQILYPTYLKLK